jgi:hypothetical protein
MPFKELYEKFIRDRDSQGIPPPPIAGKIDERFWMKESVSMKRFYNLIDSVLNPYTGKRGVSQKPNVANAFDSILAGVDSPALGVGASNEISSSGKHKKSKKHKRKRSSGEDTDTMLGQELAGKDCDLSFFWTC